MDIELGADEQSDCGAEPRVRLQNLRHVNDKVRKTVGQILQNLHKKNLRT